MSSNLGSRRPYTFGVVVVFPVAVVTVVVEAAETGTRARIVEPIVPSPDVVVVEKVVVENVVGSCVDPAS